MYFITIAVWIKGRDRNLTLNYYFYQLNTIYLKENGAVFDMATVENIQRREFPCRGGAKVPTNLPLTEPIAKKWRVR